MRRASVAEQIKAVTKQKASKSAKSPSDAAPLRVPKAGRVEACRAADVLGTSTSVTVDMVRSGLQTKVVGELSQYLDLPAEQTLRYINLSKQTFARRKASKKLTAAESDRVWRVADVVAKATQLLGDSEEAARWLRAPAPALQGESPLERASTEIGARDVERLIGRLEHGIPT